MRFASSAFRYLLPVLLLIGCKASHSGIWPDMPPNPLVAVPDGSTPAQVAQLATEVRPSTRQWQWQRREFLGFIHFGPNTFTGKEWGSGQESPADFAPAQPDPGQWVNTAKNAGMKGLILTVKHHDGFCLWPSRFTDFDILASPVKKDLLREFSDSCRKAGLAMGFYISPADLHEMLPGGRYGNGSKAEMVYIPQGKADSMPYLLDEYNRYFMEQLYELLTQYGPVSEIWLDGANPRPGSGQVYNYEAWYHLIRRLQPEAVIAVKGPDVRWCGNEAGMTREAEWSIIPLPDRPETQRWEDRTAADLGSRRQLEKARFLYWYPAETNTSMRYGWFYRDSLQYVKPVEELLDVWYNSVGGNSVFLLNMTPDRSGRIPSKDVAILESLGAEIKKTFLSNLALKADVITINENVLYRAANLTDGNERSVWSPAFQSATYELSLEFDKGFREFNVIELREPIERSGQRIESFAIDGWIDNHWEEIGQGQTIGYRKLVRTIPVRSNQLRLRILQCRGLPVLSEIGVYNREIRLQAPLIRRNKQGLVFMSSIPKAEKYKFTTDSTPPSTLSETFYGPFEMPAGGLVQAISLSGNRRSLIGRAEFDIAPAKWRAQQFSSQWSSGYYKAENAIDGDVATIWMSQVEGPGSGLPQSLTIDLGELLDLKGVTYQTPIDIRDGLISRFEILLSQDGSTWTPAPLSENRFERIIQQPGLRKVFFSVPQRARYIKWNILETADGRPFVSVGEFGVLTR